MVSTSRGNHAFFLIQSVPAAICGRYIEDRDCARASFSVHAVWESSNICIRSPGNATMLLQNWKGVFRLETFQSERFRL